MIRVVVVDDQALVRAGLVAILGSAADIEVVGEADDGDTGVTAVRELQPDVVLMDVRMPRLDGIEAIRRLHDVASRVLVLTTFDLDQHVYAALRAGASGFLLKDAPPEALLDAVRASARGDALLAPSVVRRLVEAFVSGPPPAGDRPDALAALTGREVEVLAEMARGRSNAEIAERLFLSEATVKTHVTRVLTKLHLRDRAQAVVAAYECGLVRPGSPD